MRPRNSGPRSNAWSASKLTNQRPFDPQLEEVGVAWERFRDEWTDCSEITVRQMPLHERFLMPVTVDEISALLARVPARFKRGLEAVILLGGSAKQDKQWRNFVYGRYTPHACVIYLHAFPKRRLRLEYRSLRPNVAIDYRRAGAQIGKTGKMHIVEFSESALKDFYLRDVLIHEIGHHVDRPNFGTKPLKKEEGFAEWFATEFGFRLAR